MAHKHTPKSNTLPGLPVVWPHHIERLAPHHTDQLDPNKLGLLHIIAAVDRQYCTLTRKVKVFRTRGAAHARFAKWKDNLDFTGQAAPTNWFEG